MRTIESWNEEMQQTESTEITIDSQVMLGCENEPVVTIGCWMKLQEIETLEEMCDYINGLDYNVQVVG